MSDVAGTASLAGIRRVHPGEASILAAVEAASFPQPWSLTALAAELQLSGALGLLATTGGGEPTGYALFRRVLDEAELLRLAVYPAARRHGLGAQLLARGEAILAGEGCTMLYLEVREDNTPARRLYERRGWRLAGRRRRYYADGGDALLYHLDL